MPGLEETRSEATEEVDKIANLLTAHHPVLSTPLSCRGAGGRVCPIIHKNKESPGIFSKGLLFSKNGGYLLSHGCAVPSARTGLTSLFGMGRGGTPTL